MKLKDGEWVLDYDKLIRSITSKTKMVFVNSPGNPTGWEMPKSQQERLLNHTRDVGCWLALMRFIIKLPITNYLLQVFLECS